MCVSLVIACVRVPVSAGCVTDVPVCRSVGTAVCPGVCISVRCVCMCQPRQCVYARVCVSLCASLSVGASVCVCMCVYVCVCVCVSVSASYVTVCSATPAGRVSVCHKCGYAGPCVSVCLVLCHSGLVSVCTCARTCWCAVSRCVGTMCPCVCVCVCAVVVCGARQCARVPVCQCVSMSVGVTASRCQMFQPGRTVCGASASLQGHADSDAVVTEKNPGTEPVKR